VDKHLISVSLKQLVDDSLFWLKNNTYTDEEFAIQFKHRIVKIHCFPNGNGRHSRLMADIIINQIFGKPFFKWYSSRIGTKGEARTEYMKAIKLADSGDILPLIIFAKHE
jgi:fido (protein-threonine AMPylation protein)